MWWDLEARNPLRKALQGKAATYFIAAFAGIGAVELPLNFLIIAFRKCVKIEKADFGSV
jgi:hypothetical protein